MIPLYLWNERGLYTGSVELDEADPMPLRSTPTKPPKLTGSQCAQWTGAGWEKLDAAPPEPEPGPEPTPDWPALIAAKRYAVETSGLIWNGYGIATDRESRSLIDQEDRAVERGLRTDGAGWKCLDLSTGITGFRPTTNAEIQDLAATVYAYVAAAFSREGVLLAAVADGSITSEMLEQGWP